MSADHIAIVNWDRFQHYKKPKPTWIKLYRDLLSDYSFSRLPLEQRWTLVGLWLLAAETGNAIPNDPAWIRQRLGLNRVPALEVLQDAGFLSLKTDPREGLDKVYSQTEKEKETKKETEKSKRFAPPTVVEVQSYAAEKGCKLDADQFVDFYVSKGWKVGKTPMKDWRAAVRNWARRDKADRNDVGESTL